MLAKVMAVALLVATMGLNVQNAAAQSAPASPLPHRCVGVGPVPLDGPDFCGCTWGEVYYRGQPLAGNHVSLHFASKAVSTTVQIYPEATIAQPIYSLTGQPIGAKRSDTMTVTTTLAGQTVARSFRAWPEADHEQHVPLVIPERGTWTPWLTGGYTRTLTVQGNILWAGGPAGLRQVDLTSNVSKTHTLPWPTQGVVGVAVAPNGHLWVAGPRHLAEWDGANWQDRPVPFAEPIRTLVVHPATGELWLGGGENVAALAVYDGAWHTVTAIAEPITGLVVDGANNLWVGTWGGGVQRHASNASDYNSGWTRYRVADGLASDFVYTLVVDNQTLWFGTRPYTQNQRNLGGISRYQAAGNTWRTYTTTHGLPADALLADSPAPILALAVDGNGSLWAGAAAGVYRLVTPDLWIKDAGVAGDGVRSLQAAGLQVVAGWASGQVTQLDQRVTPGQPPTAQISQTQTITLTQLESLKLTASAVDHDADPRESSGQILAWDWRSDRNGPLCTTAGACELPANILSLGLHTVSLRVQDDEGVWSQPVTTQVVVTQVQKVYLPQVQR